MNNFNQKDIKQIMSAYLSGKNGQPLIIPIFACHAHDPLAINFDASSMLGPLMQAAGLSEDNLGFFFLSFCYVRKIQNQNFFVATVVLDEETGRYQSFEQVEYFHLSDVEGCNEFLNMPWELLEKPEHRSILSFKKPKPMSLSEFKRTIKTWIKSAM